MQTKKNIKLLVSLISIIVLIIIFFVFSTSKNNTSVDKGIFQILNLEKIDHIVLHSSTQEVDLKFDGTKWLVNGQEADRQMIKVLFAALKQIEAKRPVATSIQDSVSKEISKSGVKISCFEGNVLSKEFWSKGNQKETYFQLVDGVPYLVTIPGYRVYLASVFEMPSNDWRNKVVFNFNWQNIKDLEVVFPGDPKQSFKASFQNKLFSIENISVTDTTKLDVFMNALFQLRAERILTESQGKSYDSLLSQKPIETITIQDIGNRTYELKIFPLQKRNAIVIGKRNEEVIELSPQVLREVFRKKDYFKGQSQ
ncbi:hypothetical protein WSM22_00500 [Cytophagales bacterium WSM2-2]|nr:hypothetical protein WSM22_00500 [Cytophagales bacterium WSM2-2]